ncbi:hypothetical protein HJG60_008676 [Phyllostomus discolor]|uniref:Uncharacterized protein n=1 Tax=Phyllostomus discolor TaxID=89673 RepID=A0A833YZE9_9CHIR|nr:hypothetical protein HJG60_008676 [Phyllostomus discolor]
MNPGVQRGNQDTESLPPKDGPLTTVLGMPTPPPCPAPAPSPGEWIRVHSHTHTARLYENPRNQLLKRYRLRPPVSLAPGDLLPFNGKPGARTPDHRLPSFKVLIRTGSTGQHAENCPTRSP